jgi:hypothetical protein
VYRANKKAALPFFVCEQLVVGYPIHDNPFMKKKKEEKDGSEGRTFAISCREVERVAHHNETKG